MDDGYEVRGINVNEDASNFALFAYCDPTIFENAVKEEKWRNVMDDEIDATKEMELGSYQIFLRGRKPLLSNGSIRQNEKKMVK